MYPIDLRVTTDGEVSMGVKALSQCHQYEAVHLASIIADPVLPHLSIV